MYKLLLILKYLRKRRIAWVSLIAVMLCTTMVLVVISVMGGWLNMFRTSFHGMSGDILVRGEPLVGFPHYQEMIDEFGKLPEVKAAAPVIRTGGLLYLRTAGGDARRMVQVMGLPDSIRNVNDFAGSLNARKNSKGPLFSLRDDVAYEEHRPSAYKGDVRTWPGMVAGAGVLGLKKDRQGRVQAPKWIDHAWAKLTVLPMSTGSVFEVQSKVERPYWIVDYSRTQIYFYDSDTVYVAFEQLQKDLDMEGRTTEIQIALKPGANPNAVKQRIRQVADTVMLRAGLDLRYPYTVMTWEEANATFIGAVENEKVLVTFLFGIISIVAIFLIFCIFYMIVVEKTRDIGIIKSVGATSSGVAGIFLGYGAAIGIVGAGLGLLSGWMIVSNINTLHQWLGKLMGIQIWKPEVYLFDKIPDTMNPPEVAVILGVAIVASVLGALVPAIRAARLDPVESLRWE